MASTRNQPSYDFLTGESSPPQPPLRQSLRKSTANRPGMEPKQVEFEKTALTKDTDLTHEELRAQIKTLQYDLKALEEEQEATALRHAQELRDAQKDAEAEVRRAQVCRPSDLTKNFADFARISKLLRTMPPESSKLLKMNCRENRIAPPMRRTTSSANCGPPPPSAINSRKTSRMLRKNWQVKSAR